MKRKPPFLKIYTDCIGKERVYYRHGTYTAALPSLNSPRFQMEYDEACRLDPETDFAAQPLFWQNRMTCLYAISNGEHIKIGVAVNPHKRMSGLQTASPRPLRLLKSCTYPNRRKALRAEKFLHQKFDKNRTHGEWFNISENDAVEALSQLHRPTPKE